MVLVYSMILMFWFQGFLTVFNELLCFKIDFNVLLVKRCVVFNNCLLLQPCGAECFAYAMLRNYDWAGVAGLVGKEKLSRAFMGLFWSSIERGLRWPY